MIAAFVVWLALGVVAYVYLGYPLLLLLLARTVGSSWRKGEPRVAPRVSIVVAAHNEERVIAQKVRNSLALEYDPARLEVVVVCDGCDDATAEFSRQAGDSRVRVVAYQPRRGKAYALNVGHAATECDILVLTDADVRLHPGTLRELVANFADERVGAVCGRTLVEPRAAATSLGERLKYRFDGSVRLLQSRIWSLPGADGGLYAIRRHLFRPLPEDTVADDMAVALGVVEQGFRVVYDPTATANEPAAPAFRAELGRKARIVAGAAPMALSWLVRRGPFRDGLIGFHLLSGKLLKYTVPCWMVVMLAASIALRTAPIGRALLVAQIGFYVTALVGYVLHRFGARLPQVALLPTYFCGVNYAAVVGLLRATFRRQSVRWEHTRLGEREVDPSSRPVGRPADEGV